MKTKHQKKALTLGELIASVYGNAHQFCQSNPMRIVRDFA